MEGGRGPGAHGALVGFGSAGHVPGHAGAHAHGGIAECELLGIGGEACRRGGDEFLLVLSGLETEQELAEMCQKIIELVSAPVKIGDDTVSVGVSIGAVQTRPDTDMHELLSDADLALYAAKAAGRGQVAICDAEFRAQVVELAELKADVVSAVHNEEFEPWFQRQNARPGGPVYTDLNDSSACCP